MGNFLGDIALGYLNAQHAANEKKREEDTLANKNLLTQAKDFWGARLEGARPEAQDAILQRLQHITTLDPAKLKDKDKSLVNDASLLYEGVKPKTGQSWLDGQTSAPMQTLAAPIQQSLEGEPVKFSQPQPQTVGYQPLPGPDDVNPNYRMPIYPTEQELARKGMAAAQTKINLEAQAAGAKKTAELQAARAFPEPDKFIGIDTESNIVNQGTGEITHAGVPDPIKAAQAANPNEWSTYLQAAGGDPQKALQMRNSDLIARRPIPASIQILDRSNPDAGMDDEIANALEKATLTYQPNKKAQVIDTVNRFVKQGNIPLARATIKQAALEGELADVRKGIQGRRSSVSTLKAVDLLLGQVPTNYLRGTMEETARRLGETTNPTYVKIGVQLRSLLQDYRRSMSGAAFSVPESNDYETMFPGFKNELPVNRALVQGLMQKFERDDQVYWDRKIGPGWSDSVNGAAPLTLTPPGPTPTQPQQPNTWTSPEGGVYETDATGKILRRIK